MNLPKGMVPPAPEPPANPPAAPLLAFVAAALAALDRALAGSGLAAAVERIEADAAGGIPRIALVLRLQRAPEGGERP